MHRGREEESTSPRPGEEVSLPSYMNIQADKLTSNECKRRKIKCNGERPCGRCGRQRVSCIYDNAPEPGANEGVGIERLYEQMNAMQAQISALTASVQSLAQVNSTPGPGIARHEPSKPHRRISTGSKGFGFQGQTTSAFSFDLAKESLKELGIEVERNEGEVTREPSPLPTPPSPASSAGQLGDPLWSIGKAEALRLCRVYEEEMGVMYPVVELEELLQNVHLLYGPAGAGSWSRDHLVGELDSDDVNILRLVFACALTAEASGSSELAMSLFERVRDAADHYVWAPPEIKSITLLALVVSLPFLVTWLTV